MKEYVTTIGIIVVLLLSSCSDSPPPNRSCPLASLMPDLRFFPIHTGHPKMYEPAPKLVSETRGIESALQEYSLGTRYPAPDSPRTTNEIQRWSDSSIAQRDYIERRDFNLLADSRYGPWSLPSAITYTSHSADETEIKCGKVEISRKTYRCWMVARYQEYIVIFETEIVSGVLELAQVNPILSDIDNRMGACLAKPVIAK